MLPGPPTAQRKWRDGSSYSPDFLAAYSLYRSGLAAAKTSDQASVLTAAAGELEALLSKHQVSKETFFILSSIYTQTGDNAKLKAVQDKYGPTIATSSWRVDTELVSPEELAGVAALSATTSSSSTSKPEGGLENSIRIQNLNPTTGQPQLTLGATLKIANKFALVIGVRNSRLPGNLDYANDDAIRVRDALKSSAGYPEDHIDVLTDPTAATILEHAKALSAKMPESSTLCVFYTGVATNIGGLDYLAGTDATSLQSETGLIKKSDLFGDFFSKGTHIFAFFQVDRSIVGPNGIGFGSEQSYVGSISQMQATTPGDAVYPTYRNGKMTGLFADAFTQTLVDLQSNKLPILEFGWQLFYHMRRGDTGISGGSSHQTCTLPHLNNLATDAQF